MPGKRLVLERLKRDELLDALDVYELEVPDRRRRDVLIDALTSSRRAKIADILADLSRNRLKEICRELDLDDGGRAKATIIERLTSRTPKSGRTPRTTRTPTRDSATTRPPENPPTPAPDEKPDPPKVLSETPVSEPPDARTVLGVLTKARLVELGRVFDVAVPENATKPEQVAALTRPAHVAFPDLLRSVSREELRAACRLHGLDDSPRARSALAERLYEAHAGEGALDAQVPPEGDKWNARLPALFADDDDLRHTPRLGDIVQVRHRQYLVDGVAEPPQSGQATLVTLVCLDDDNQGRELQVFWELELGARVLQPQAHGLGRIDGLDAPRHFCAYLQSLKWNAVTATDARLFQAPFRAGIRLLNHQLTPLKKALELPRANLFIADDVGLGKTIEAGLVLQELLLRQRVELVLVVAPAAICLQWQGEMAKRFGLRFELYNRAFIARRRRQRGFAVNPWMTHNRFIISYQTLRRPEYRDPLLEHLSERARKSLLVLDEAHTAAPASASKYAVDSRITRVVRDVAPRFENRLFLSATPHNGHSNSFSALLELLDPQRFTRGVQVTDTARLEPVMVRRLKSDLSALNVPNIPRRHVVAVDLHYHDGAWSATTRLAQASDGEREEVKRRDAGRRDLGPGPAAELELAAKLAEYTELMKPRKGRGKLVFVNLQKRLLSSIEAFWRTLELHATNVGAGKAKTALDLARASRLADEDEYGWDDETLEAAGAAVAAASSRRLRGPEGRARQLLEEMRELAARHRTGADAKALALLDWIRTHQCPGVAPGGARGAAAASAAADRHRHDRHWSDRRLIVFTEYGDTKRYLAELLAGAFEGTERGADRILEFHGNMSDEQREEVQEAFNGAPDRYPVRVLLATDAAREGVNLQGHCQDLFHYDVPWNPARMEQRNGRIDRTLQRAEDVFCHYFFYPQRDEDLVLTKLVHKVDVIQKELGSLSAVVLDRFEAALEEGIDERTPHALDAAEATAEARQRVRAELEASRNLEKLKQERDEAGRILDKSRRQLELSPDLLRDAVDVGLELAGAASLVPLDPPGGPPSGPIPAFSLPELPDSWQETLDYLRPPRRRDEAFWDWRRKPPRPVVFEALETMDGERVHLHLEHPFVQRILARFLAQGYSAHDLSRVTALVNPEGDVAQVIAFGRLSLFGSGAARLHDALVTVAAPWLESRGPGHLDPYTDKVAESEALGRLDRLLKHRPAAVSDGVAGMLRDEAAGTFASLWPHIRDEAESLAHDAESLLDARGAEESAALQRILETQRAAIRRTLDEHAQLALEFDDHQVLQREQFEQDKLHMERRLLAIDREIEREPKQISELYKVATRRLEPVGLVYLWPKTWG